MGGTVGLVSELSRTGLVPASHEVRTESRRMKFIGVKPISDPSDLIRLEISGLGVLDLYNEAQLIEYAWLFGEAKFKVSFQLCESAVVVDLVFSGITFVETIRDPGPIDNPRNVEFIRFVFGEEFLSSELSPSEQRNVEFATNLVDYRFWAECVEASVRQ